MCSAQQRNDSCAETVTFLTIFLQIYQFIGARIRLHPNCFTHHLIEIRKYFDSPNLEIKFRMSSAKKSDDKAWKTPNEVNFCLQFFCVAFVFFFNL